MSARIHIACPQATGPTGGNRVTASRWRRLLGELGHRVRIVDGRPGPDRGGAGPDLLVALHARRSAAAVRAYRQRFPDRPLVVTLTGTDLYHDLPNKHRAALRSVETADRLIVLHDRASRALPARARRRARVIRQSAEFLGPSAELLASPPGPPRGRFQVALLASLRAVKDPLRPALAARLASADSRLLVAHLGAGLEASLVRRAERESERNPRYRWLGDRRRPAALRLLAASAALVLPSRAEGGANVIGEAARLGVPILASRIEGTLGLVGGRHPGLFDVGDTSGLARLFQRAEDEPDFLERLAAASRALAPRFEPAREREAWRALLAELL